MSLKKHGKYRFQDFEVDLAHRSLKRGGHGITIGGRTLDLLTFLILNPQRVVSREELVAALWPGLDVEESDLGQHVFLLRKALSGVQSGDRLVLTIPGRGYQFTAPVTEVLEAEIPVHSQGSRDALSDRLVSEPTEYVSPLSSDASPEIRDAVHRYDHGVDWESGEEIGKESRDENDSVRERRRSSPGFFAGLRQPGPWHVLAVTAALAALGFGGLFAWRWAHRVKPQSLGLVIADFDNSTGDLQFDSALEAAAAMDLEQSPFLSIASPAAVNQALKDMKTPAGEPIKASAAREVCTRIHDQAYLTGTIHRFARLYVVGLEAFDCATGHSLARSRGLASTPDGVVAVLDKVAADLRKQLGEPPNQIALLSRPLFAGRTASLDALKGYAEARRLLAQNKAQESIALFQRAVETDPQFGKAFADMGIAYSQLGQRDLASASLTRAFELRDSVSESDRLFILATYNDLVTGDIQTSIRSYKDWSNEYPHNPVPLVNFADLETQIGRPSLALEPARRSLELNPTDARTYVVLARAEMALNQFEQAADTCQLAIRRHLDDGQIHGFLLQIAFLRLDQPAMDEQFAWAHNEAAHTPAEAYMQVEQGLMDFAAGKAKSGATAMSAAAEDYRKLGRSETAAQILSGVPRIEAELGNTETALTQLTRMSAGTDSSTDSNTDTSEDSSRESTDVPVAWAHVGETARAESLLKAALDAHLTTTLWQEDFGPQVKAAIALNQHRPEDAVEALKPAIPYDMRSFDAPGLRGRAYLIAKQPDLAEAEFHKILEHPGIEPLSHNYPLAQLGVARALAQEGKPVEAGFAYKIVLQIWKDADPDLPRFKEAKAEYAKLTSAPVRSSPAATASHSTRKPTAARR